jgi:hypothetical protein
MATKRRRSRRARPHLVLRLRKGWSYDPSARCFRKKGCEPVQPGGDLPKYTRIQLQTPALASRRSLAPEEDDLARGIQLVPPRGARLQRVLARVTDWPCVEKAWIAAEPALPRR